VSFRFKAEFRPFPRLLSAIANRELWAAAQFSLKPVPPLNVHRQCFLELLQEPLRCRRIVTAPFKIGNYGNLPRAMLLACLNMAFRFGQMILEQRSVHVVASKPEAGLFPFRLLHNADLGVPCH